MHRKGRRRAPGYSTGPTTKVPNWHGLVVFDLLLNSVTTGVFLAAAVGELTAPAIFAPVAGVAYLVAFVALLGDLVCLVLDLGDPWRFHHMLRVFKPTSPMSLGTWCLTVYSLPLTVVAGIVLLPVDWSPPHSIRCVVVALGILPALGVAIYKGVLFSTSAQPGWKDARWLGGYLTNSAFVVGCGVVLALAVLTGVERAVAVLRPALAGLLVLNAVFLGLLAFGVRVALADAYTLAERLRLGAQSLVAVLLPLGLLLLGGPLPIIGAAVVMLLEAASVRRELVRFPHLATEAAHRATPKEPVG